MVRDLMDFMERVKEDKKLQEKMEEIANRSSGEDVFDSCSALAAELGYSITEEDMEAFADEYEMSDEELDGIAGGLGGNVNWLKRFSREMIRIGQQLNM